MTALRARLRLTKNCSSGSTFASPLTRTVMVLVVSPGANLSVPDLPAKSPSLVLADPFAGAYLTLTSSELGAERLTVKTNAVWPLWPSARATSLMLMAGLALGSTRLSSSSSCGRNDRADMVRPPLESRSAAQEEDIAAGAQTERQGGAGPVRGLLGGKDPIGRFHVAITLRVMSRARHAECDGYLLCPVSLSHC